MADIIQFDPASTPVANRVTDYKRSVDSNLWIGVPNVLFDPVLPAVPESQTLAQFLGQCVVDGGLVREMTQAEKDSIAAANVAAQAAAEAADLIEVNALLQSFDTSTDKYYRLIKAVALACRAQFNTLRQNPTTVYPAITDAQLIAAIKALL